MVSEPNCLNNDYSMDIILALSSLINNLLNITLFYFNLFNRIHLIY